MPRPTVSAIIVNWNHGHVLGQCLDAILDQDYANLDVTIIDNGSTDGSPGRLAQSRRRARLHRFPNNRGFSRALNWGVDHTASDYVLSLNPDVIARRDFVTELVQAATFDERVGAVAPKLLRAEDPAILDSTGLYIDRRRRPYDRGQGQIDRGQYDSRCEVFGACGAAALYRRAMLEDVQLRRATGSRRGGEYFDEDFFAYYEDADLAWRAQLRRWRCVHAPSAVAAHARGWGDTLRKRRFASSSPRGPRLALCNRYLMTIKNDTGRHVLVDLPQMLAAELPRLAYAAFTAPAVLLGIVDLARQTRRALEKRRHVRSNCTADETAVRRWFVSPASLPAGGCSPDAKRSVGLL